MKKFEDFMQIEMEPFMQHFDAITRELRNDPALKDNNDAMVGSIAIHLSIKLLNDYHNWLHDIPSEAGS